MVCVCEGDGGGGGAWGWRRLGAVSGPWSLSGRQYIYGRAPMGEAEAAMVGGGGDGGQWDGGCGAEVTVGECVLCVSRAVSEGW